MSWKNAGGVAIGHPEPGPRGSGQRMKEHKLRVRVFAVVLPLAAEVAAVSDLDPVGGTVDGAPETGRVHEGLQQK